MVGRNHRVGEPDFGRLPQPSICHQAGASGALHPMGTFLIFEKGVGCLLPGAWGEGREGEKGERSN